MKKTLIFVCFFYCINAHLTKPKECRNCLGKIHTKAELELTKQPLVINKNQTCQHEKYKFIVVVKSGSFRRRNFTRSTWAKEIIEHFNVPVLYAIGYPNDSRLQEEIIYEDKKHNDILQFNIMENYYNLTLKTTSVLLWYDRYYSKSTDFLLYVDDDVLIHVDKLIVYMNQLNQSDSIQGWFEKSAKIQRKGLGGVSKGDFPIDVVPDYLWGAAVLYPSQIVSNALIPAIFNTSLPIFFRDDAFINGFIAEEAGIKREYMKGILLYDNTEDDIKTQMIIIDFTNEERREMAWNCYKYDINCNKNLALLLFEILCGVIIGVLLLRGCFRLFRRTSIYEELNYNLRPISRQLWYTSKIIVNSTLAQTILFFPRLWIFKRICLGICFIFIIIFVILYSLQSD